MQTHAQLAVASVWFGVALPPPRAACKEVCRSRWENPLVCVARTLHRRGKGNRKRMGEDEGEGERGERRKGSREPGTKGSMSRGKRGEGLDGGAGVERLHPRAVRVAVVAVAGDEKGRRCRDGQCRVLRLHRHATHTGETVCQRCTPGCKCSTCDAHGTHGIHGIHGIVVVTRARRVVHSPGGPRRAS